jgi:Spy/CpxP family protein refolding chaperone
MSIRSEAKGKGWIGRPALRVVLALAAGCLVSAHAATEAQDADAKAPARGAPRHHNRPGTEDRVKTLAQALDLDAKQQAELRKVLQGERDAIRRVWSDVSVPGAYRVAATQAISDRTADLIRALLNDEQRKKYKPPRVPHDPAADSAKPNLEAWMNATKPK